MRRLFVITAFCMFACQAFAQTAQTRAALESQNNATVNDQNKIFGHNLNSLYENIIYSMGALGDNNTWTGVNTFGSGLIQNNSTACAAGFSVPIGNPSIIYNCTSRAPIPINGVSTTDAYANWSQLGFMSGPHSSQGVNNYGAFFDFMAAGSGGLNPNADVGTGCNIIKQGFGLTAQSLTNSGEIDCAYFISRQVGPSGGGSDSSAALFSADNIAGSGFMAAWEAVSTEFQSNYTTINYSIDTSTAVLEDVGATHVREGFVATSLTGANIDAFIAQNNGSSGTWTNALSTVDSCGSSGYNPLHITLDGTYELTSCSGGVVQPYWIMSNVTGFFELASGTSTLMLSIDQSGNTVVYGAFSAPSLPVGGTPIGTVCIDANGHFFTKTASGACT